MVVFDPAVGGFSVRFDNKTSVIVTVILSLEKVIHQFLVGHGVSVNIAGNMISYEMKEIY